MLIKAMQADKLTASLPGLRLRSIKELGRATLEVDGMAPGRLDKVVLKPQVLEL